MFITAFTRARHLSLPWASSIQSILPHPTSWRSILPNLMSLFPCLARNKISVQVRSKCSCSVENPFFYGEECSTPRPTPKLEEHPLSAVSDCLFNIFTGTFHIGGRSYIRNLRTRHAVVTEIHLSRTNSLIFNKSTIMCFVWIWEQTAIISLYSINWLVFITDGVCLLRGTFYILRSAHTVYICVLCGSENKQRLFHCTVLTGWFL